jgi:hypothetical protein
MSITSLPADPVAQAREQIEQAVPDEDRGQDRRRRERLVIGSRAQTAESQLVSQLRRARGVS